MKRLFKLVFFLSSLSQNISGQTTITEACDKLLLPYYKTNEPGGVILVSKNEQVIYKKAFGLANMELNVPVNDSTIFYIGSNTKQFTAAALLQLMEKNQIQLNDSLGKFISACPYPVSSITVKQLLSHTSGLGSNNETAGYKLIDRKGVTPIELVNYYIHIPMDFTAGSKWVYNNANFYILGYLIEKLTGKSYADYVTENIFKPAGMFNTYMSKELFIIKNRASGYTNFRLGIFNATVSNVSTLYASGGIQSTADDMLKWNRALNSGKFLKPETIRLLYTPQVLPNGKLISYGMGFHIQDLRGSPALRHGGLIEGFTSETLYLPKEDVYVVILLNEETSKIPITALARILAALAIGKPYVFEKVVINKNELAKFIGVYENDRGELINITKLNGQLSFQRPNGALYNLYYAGNNEFFFERDYLRIEFTSDAAGKIKSLKFSAVDIGMTEWFKTQRPLLKLSPERIADSLLKQYAGKYFLANNDTLTISKEGPSLYYHTGSQPKQLLAAENNMRFHSLQENFPIEFSRDPATGVLTLLVTQRTKKKKYLRF